MNDDYQDALEKETTELVIDVVDRIQKLTQDKLIQRRAKLYDKEGEYVKALEVRNNEIQEDKKVLIVVATQKNQTQWEESDEYIAINKIIYDNTFSHNSEVCCCVEVEVIFNNKSGLSKVYNEFMTPEYEDYIICYIHDDVVLYDNHFYEKLINSHKIAPIVGLAGATKVNLPFSIDSPTSWGSLSIEKDERGKNVKAHQSGFVMHVKGGKMWSSCFGLVPQKIKIFDGLFMSFDISKCLDKGFRFDEDFDFHHYDISASVIAMKLGLEAVTSDILVKHKSVGVMDATWVVSHRKFVDKYKGFLG